MATKKPKTVAEIPKRNLLKFAKTLVGTTWNVFTLAKVTFGAQLVAGDDLFDRLKAEGKVEKCEECNYWVDSPEMDRSIKGFCTECVDKMNGDDTEGEEDEEE